MSLPRRNSAVAVILELHDNIGYCSIRRRRRSGKHVAKEHLPGQKNGEQFPDRSVV